MTLKQSVAGMPSPWRELAITMIVGIPLVMVVGIVWDLTGDRQAWPDWTGDWVPREQWVCIGAPQTADDIRKRDELLEAMGWPDWPDPIPDVVCGDTVPDGVVMWTSMKGRKGPRVYAERGGDTERHHDGETPAKAAVVYLDADTMLKCTPFHEHLHARGLGRPGSRWSEHASAATSILADPCGEGLQKLNRNPGGDWPYGD